jgi:hypothetical protein
MFCNKCGHQFDGHFCPKCGAKAKNAPETIENTNAVSEENNPFNVYYQETESKPSASAFEAQPQPTEQKDNYTQSVNTQPPVQSSPYQTPPPYYAPQPAKSNVLTWWQITLIVIAAIIGTGLVTQVIPIACLGCAFVACEESCVEDITSSTTIDEIVYPGQVALSDDFSYVLTQANVIEKYANKTSWDGYKLIEVTIKVENTSNHSQYTDYDLSCYVGNTLYNEVIDDGAYYSQGELLPGKNYMDTRVFEVPYDATSIELLLNEWEAKTIKFIIE